MWEEYRYYQVVRGKFTISECAQIVAFHRDGDAVLSKLSDASGNILRDSHILWLRRTQQTEWIFARVTSAVLEYNAAYRFEISGQPDTAQLTRYAANQQYSWHMDLGSGRSSLRKITAVVELSSRADHTGGGIEIFYGEEIENKVTLDIGDMIIFPSFVMHKASRVDDGVRWSLVLWFNGDAPFS
jgi:PKHD-type hydroxylase